MTVSWKAYRSSTLFGVKLRISSNIGIKALDASENYILEQIPPEDRSRVALSYALILPIQLMLHGVTMEVYYDSPKIDSPEKVFHQRENSPYLPLFTELSKNFPQVEFIPTVKGPLIERLRTKLTQVSQENSNEIIPGNIIEICQKTHGIFSARKEDNLLEGENKN